MDLAGRGGGPVHGGREVDGVYADGKKQEIAEREHGGGRRPIRAKAARAHMVENRRNALRMEIYMRDRSEAFLASAVAGNFRKKEDEEEREKDTQQGRQRQKRRWTSIEGSITSIHPQKPRKAKSVSMEENVVVSVVVEESHCRL